MNRKMALVQEYNLIRQNERTSRLTGFSERYNNFFGMFMIDCENRFRFWPAGGYYTLSGQLRLECSHGAFICNHCREAKCVHNNAHPCSRCFRPFSERGVRFNRKCTDTRKEEAVLELMDFAYTQRGWIKDPRTQNQIRQNPEKMKNECGRRIQFFINKLYEKNGNFRPRLVAPGYLEEAYRRMETEGYL